MIESECEGGFPESAALMTIPVKPSANCSDSVANFTKSLLSFLRFLLFHSPSTVSFSSISLSLEHTLTHMYAHTYTHSPCLKGSVHAIRESVDLIG